MNDRLWAGKPPQYFTELHRPTQPTPLTPSVGWEMSTNQSAVILCGWGVKAGWHNPCVDECVGSR